MHVCCYRMNASHLHGNSTSSNLRFLAMSILWFQRGALYRHEGLIFVPERNVTCVLWCTDWAWRFATITVPSKFVLISIRSTSPMSDTKVGPISFLNLQMFECLDLRQILLVYIENLDLIYASGWVHSGNPIIMFSQNLSTVKSEVICCLRNSSKIFITLLEIGFHS